MSPIYESRNEPPIAVVGILLAPVVHRVLHRFHWEENE